MSFTDTAFHLASLGNLLDQEAQAIGCASYREAPSDEALASIRETFAAIRHRMEQFDAQLPGHRAMIARVAARAVPVSQAAE